MAVIFVGIALSYAAFWTPAMALLSDEVERARVPQSYAFAFTNIAWSAGQVVGNSGGGALAEATADWVCYGAVALLCAVTFAGPGAAAAENGESRSHERQRDAEPRRAGVLTRRDGGLRLRERRVRRPRRGILRRLHGRDALLRFISGITARLLLLALCFGSAHLRISRLGDGRRRRGALFAGDGIERERLPLQRDHRLRGHPHRRLRAHARVVDTAVRAL